MQKVDDIKELCSELLYNPDIHSQKLMKHLSLSAGLIENDITQEGCDDWFERSMNETARYIGEKSFYAVIRLLMIYISCCWRCQEQ